VRKILILFSILTLALASLWTDRAASETMKGIGEIIAHKAMLPAPVGSDSIAFLRFDQNIPGKPLELFVRNLKSGDESRMLPGFDFREMPSYTFAFDPSGSSFVVPRLIAGEWELLRYKTGDRKGEVLTELRKFRKDFPADINVRLKTKSEMLVTISDVAYSPSADRVIFNVGLPDRTAVWMLNLETKEIRQVTPDNVGYYPQVCPDDEHIYYTANAVRADYKFDQDILRRSIVTGDIDTLVSAGGNEFAGVFSPDQKYIAYSQRTNESTDVWVKNLTTAESKKLTSAPKNTHCTFPRWSADGKWIYYQVQGVEDWPMLARHKFTAF